jgi:pimeloyl-ACP methyl ester carboxylesterase
LNEDQKMKQRLLLLSAIVSLVILTTCRTRKPGELVFESYRFATYDGQKIDAQLGRLTVPENRNDPQSQLIELAFVVLKSSAKNPEAPIVFLAGGPGVATIEHAKGPRSSVLLALREIADVVLLDQRGAGLSKPNLSCDERLDYPLNQPASREGLLETFKQQARMCTAEKRRTVDLNAYNTEESANDVNALREALGVNKISLIGSSYGTTLALTIIRRYGEHIHRAIMVGVEAPDQTIKLPGNGQKQLLKLADICKNDPKVGPNLPDLVGTLTMVAERLRKQPATVEVHDARFSQQKVLVTVGEFDLKLMTALSIGYDAGIREFPAELYSMSQGDYSSLGKWALRFRTQTPSVVQAATDCASGVSIERWKQIQDEEKTAFLGREFDFPFPDVCEAWGVRQLELPYRSEIKSDVNALFISGTLDGRTPVSNAEEIKKGFPNSTMVIVEGAAHGDRLFVGSPQISEIMLDFLKGNPRSVMQVFLPPIDFEPLKVRVTAQ